MEFNEVDKELAQKIALDNMYKFPYLIYLNGVRDKETGEPSVIENIPDNFIDYMVVDLDVGRLKTISISYAGDYYDFTIEVTNPDFGVITTYMFKITPELKDLLDEAVHAMTIDFDTEDEFFDRYISSDKPKLRVIKGGKED